MPKNLEFENAKFLVGKFCKYYETINWGKELKTIKMVLRKYPFEFLKDLDFQLKGNACSWFFIPEGKAFLEEQFKLFKARIAVNLDIIEKQEPKQEKKLGEDKEVKEKIKNLKDFLKI